MKEQQCEIVIRPSGEVFTGTVGDSLYTLLLVAGIIDPGDPHCEWLRLEKGSVSPAQDPEVEEKVFTASQLSEGWLLASQRLLTGNAELTMFDFHDDKNGLQLLPSGYGLIVDLGTATVCAGLVGADSLHICTLSASRNNILQLEMKYVDHIDMCLHSKEKSAQFCDIIQKQLQILVDKLTLKTDVDKGKIQAMVLVGRNELIHMLLPAVLKEDNGQAVKISCREAGLLDLDHDFPLYVLPQISADLGPDTVATILVARLLQKKDDPQVTLLLDMGMRSEIIGCGFGRIVACSVPTSPLEGVGISCGMQSVTGAITQVNIEENNVVLKTVRNARPAGICGAGLISAIHAMLDEGMIDSGGHIIQPKGLSEAMKMRFRGTAAGREFVISWKDEYFPHDICINQEDILQLQMAKGAVRAAFDAVLDELGATEADISQVLLAEPFRANIHQHDALAIGMLPRVGQDQVQPIGNAAWQGAYQALCDQIYMQETQLITTAVERMDLSGNRVYAKSFIEAMDFSMDSDF